jgi:hypothetical protein
MEIFDMVTHQFSTSLTLPGATSEILWTPIKFQNSIYEILWPQKVAIFSKFQNFIYEI